MLPPEPEVPSLCRSRRQPAEIEAAFDQLQKELEADINQKMRETQQLLLENFDEDIHDLLKLRLDAAEQRLDKVGRWFWALTQHELQSLAAFNEANHSFELKASIPQVPSGLYQLHKRGSAQQSDNELAHAHRYRLSAPLGEWVVQQAIRRELPPAELLFDYSSHTAKVPSLRIW